MIDDIPLKVLIVDDEEHERELIKICINWSEIGMEICKACSSAREVLDSLDEENPDIVITDIRMPFMDGLELSKIIAETYPHIKVIILTAHEEFEYAKAGIKVGISDFLLKPIRRDELRKTLNRIKDKIFDERMQKNQHEELKEKLEESLPYLKEKFLNELILYKIDRKEFDSKIEYFGININANYIQVAIIEVGYSERVKMEEQKVLFLMKCTEFVKKYFKDDKGIEVFVDNSQRIVVFCSDKEVNLVECCEQIKIMIINRLKCSASIGVGSLHDGFNNIKKSYDEAVEALNYKVVYGKNHIINFEDTSISKNQWNISIDTINEIGFNVKIGANDRVVDLIQSIFNEIGDKKFKSIEYIRVVAVNIVTTVLNSIVGLGINYNDVFKSNELPYADIMKIETLPDIEKYLNKLMVHIINTVKSIRSKKTNKIVSEILDYIKMNLSKPSLTLSSTAKEFYLNSSYLSRIFKQETGCTFVEYLTKVRIERSTQLFKDTELMMYEVAEKIGIPDPNYFGKCFKRYMGMSVNDYKKQLN